MKTHSKIAKRTLGWTLIEIIGVLAVAAILAAVFIPATVKHMDRLVAEQEVSTLKSFADALQDSVLTTRTIPDATTAPTWSSTIASRLGFGVNDVLYNAHQQAHLQQRVYLIDPAMQAGLSTAPSGLPYSQVAFSASGSPMRPVNLRVMIVSSLGRALPAAVASGVFGTTLNGYFADLWNAADGTIPSDAAWTGWAGRPEDVLVQRINLAPLFVHLVLGKYNSATTGYYAVDPVVGTTVPTDATTIDGYFIRGTVLGLYKAGAATDLDTKLILNSDRSLVFEQGIWRGTLLGSSLGGSDGVVDVVQQFLEAVPNVNAAHQTPPNQQQILIVNDMLNYMTVYNQWANGGFSDNTLKNQLKNTIQPQMMTDIQQSYLSGTYYPVNTTACP